ncbi:MAG: acyl-CoA thioesterase [Acidobacteria bacterium]|nr:acyl-CoA thioesterase [Acidobacteriota bacterium]
MSYKTIITVNFGDVDPAHIVYYPIIFHYCHIAFERFFTEFVGITYPKLLKDEEIGFPTVNATASFSHPIHYGDHLEVTLKVDRIGKSSIDFSYVGKNLEGQEYFHANITVVAVSMVSFTPVIIPNKYRECFTKCS